MSTISCHEANIEKPCVECINYFKCKDREWRSCFFGEKEYWNQIIFVDELTAFATKDVKEASE